MIDKYHPGERNHPAGIYIEVGPRGGHLKHPRHCHVKANHKLPPTSKHGNVWVKESH